MGENKKGRDKRIHQKANLLSLPDSFFSLYHNWYWPAVLTIQKTEDLLWWEKELSNESRSMEPALSCFYTKINRI